MNRAHAPLIPTLIFIDANGKEVFRHEGFMPKEDIVAKLKEMGVAPATTGRQSQGE